MRPWLGIERTLASLNREAQARGLQTENAIPVRFVPPATKDAYYEVKVYRSGEVETRPDNVHDFFNALAWLAFPQAKARLNALHAAEIPREGGRRGRLRDLLTIFDEGGAIVQCDQPDLLALLHAMQWKDLFWHQRARLQREMRILVFGHAVLEQALEALARDHLQGDRSADGRGARRRHSRLARLARARGIAARPCTAANLRFSGLGAAGRRLL